MPENELAAEAERGMPAPKKPDALAELSHAEFQALLADDAQPVLVKRLLATLRGSAERLLARKQKAEVLLVQFRHAVCAQALKNGGALRVAHRNLERIRSDAKLKIYDDRATGTRVFELQDPPAQAVLLPDGSPARK